MPDVEALRQFFSVQTGVWTAVAILTLFVARMWNGSPAMFAQWIAYRRAKAEEKAADWQRLRDEITRLDDGEKRCRAELIDVTKRLATLEGYEMGRGKAAQDAAAMVAIDRLENHKDAPESDAKFGENGK